MRLTRYTEQHVPTPYTAYTEEDSDPTVRIDLTKSDALWEAHERMRMGSYEAAGVWLLVAGEL